ncbi:MAG TPA: NAD(P)/FAD-dependent oxidoreductase [Acidimicrobiales bacterium]|jgi:4-hydroxyacetophenone monooxygenase|nr:NAD(P)/FAD-dependent oxidoreductase [Acidimicrobiales bacterium]
MMKTPVPDPTMDLGMLSQAVAAANLPTLLMVLFQLTGDRRWLEDPYRPSRRFGMDPNDSGGFPDAIADEIRAEAHLAISKWATGTPAAVPNPSGELMKLMMSLVVSEEVPPEYEPMMAVQMGFAAQRNVAPCPVPDDFRVVVIGAGLGGLMSAIRLEEAGIPYVVLERFDHAGGVWWANHYPGAGVDTPSYLYSFSFFPRNWSTYFAKRDELVAYVDDLIDHYDLAGKIRYGVEVRGGEFNESKQRWFLRTTDAEGHEETIEARAVISSVGVFSQPKTPDLPGMADFEGAVFHSARWPDDLDVTGKRVALVGTGASSMQILPAIVDRAESIDVFQRSPGWVSPVSNYFEPVPAPVHWMMENVPFYYAWYRFSLAWTFNDKLHPTLQIDPDWPDFEHTISAVNDRHRRMYTEYLMKELDGRPDLQEKCLPDYPPWGKRMLIDNGWYAALRQPHVELFAEEVVAITPGGLVGKSGVERPADVIVYSTGFEATRFLLPMELRGRDGIELRDYWEDDNAKAYLGICTPNFPNLFFVYGPNTNGSGGSFLAWSESQVDYIVQLLQAMVEQGIGTLEPRPDLHEAYNREVDEAHSRMIWTHPRLTTYYRNSRGRVVVNNPWRVVDTWHRLRHAALDEYITEPTTERVGRA